MLRPHPRPTMTAANCASAPSSPLSRSLYPHNHHKFSPRRRSAAVRLGKARRKRYNGSARDHYQSSQSTHSSFYVSDSDSTFKERPLIELGRRRRQRKKEKKQSKKRKRKLLASPIQSSDDSDVPLSSLLRRSHSPNGRANFVDDDVVYHNDSLLEIARKTRLSQASSPHKSKYHIIPVDTKTPADRLVRCAPLDGDFTISKILANMRNDVSLYGNDSDRANYIQQLDINSKAYEGKCRFSRAFSCFQLQHSVQFQLMPFALF